MQTRLQSTIAGFFNKKIRMKVKNDMVTIPFFVIYQ
jgi:hypothetical protein